MSSQSGMKILWVSPFFLHPTDRGGQIRTLGTLKELHKRHEIHFAALNNAANQEGVLRCGEYSSQHVAVEHAAPKRGSAAMLPQLAGSLFSTVPLAVSRYDSARLREAIRQLIAANHYDSIVCDFLASAPNLPELKDAVLFQHNVETTIWERHVEQAPTFVKRQFFVSQARKMRAYEKKVCRASRHVIAVSDVDAARMKTMFGIEGVSAVPTGVDLDYFRAPAQAEPTSDLVFSGSMDWLPNIDAMEYFLREIFPLILRQRPETSLTIAGRSPDPRVLKAAEGLPSVTITGSVPDIRPFLWNAQISIVPLRIGGGTRLKIYECMAAGLPIVSTSIGAEGLSFTAGEDLLLADSPVSFADACLRMLRTDVRDTIAASALRLVETRFSWAAVTTQFETILEQNRIRHGTPYA
jgi:glycosyltransferase involved in cell wall biosynthesis